MSNELLEMSEKEYELIEELVFSVKKLNDSLVNVADAVYDLRASLCRMRPRVEE